LGELFGSTLKILTVCVLIAAAAACSPVPAENAADATDAKPVYDWHGEPSERAIERYIAVHGAVSHNCAEYARSTRFEYVTTEQLARVCERTGLLGCFLTDKDHNPVAYVRDDVYAQTLVHEVMHGIAACQTANSDADHADTALWAGLMGHGQ